MNKFNANVKDAAGYVKEETGEMLDDKKMAKEGRELRNEGRMEKGEFPKTGEPGEGHKDEKDWK